MNIRNFLSQPLEKLEHCHDGKGILNHISLFSICDFDTNIEFINYTVLLSGTSIGEHTHGNDEELYIILEGTGLMTVNGETRSVNAGDIIVNKPFGTHGLANNSEGDLKILVIGVRK